ncbi:efflux transporter outer membrane subunit [Novosphingobium sp. CECT 9465]|uniref:efflux transporter outer membrane subunit n=1 Tax=Novosphingobium sp. CECT 9465 TaxID=2829794 RepID=UPI001E2A2788|nr:efflux transporter outer membrane subunit [Novosphingobium sp. CECT 9465]CAH0497442.1 putative efflux pump outer membrane protein TtgC [Novosphingobium sp. CECT 9465]
MIRIRLSIAVLPMLALGGCNLAPKYVRPEAPVTPKLPQGPAYPALAEGETTVDALGWRLFFTDARLQQVIAKALSDNRDLRIAVANVERARALYRVERAALIPAIGTTGTASETRASAGRVTDNFSVQAGVSAYEIDLFGRLRNQSASAFQSYLATDEGRKATQIALVAETASAWLTHAATADALRIAEETLVSRRETLALNIRREANGIGTRLDVASATTAVNSAEADVADFRTSLAQARNALDLLAGDALPDDLLPMTLGNGDYLRGSLPVGLSSAVLLRRPDVLAAEHDLRAAYADIGAARAAFFPTISLTGLLGFASSGLGALFDGDSFQKSVSGNARQTIFDGGGIAGNLGAANASRDAALAAYERAIQSAFREVSDALARRGTIDDKVTAQASLESNAAIAYRLTQARFDAGIANYLEPLDAQRTLYTAKQALVLARLTRAANMVELYRALGGGLNEGKARPAEATSSP